MPDDDPPMKVNVNDVPLIERMFGEHWGGRFKPLTPSMKRRGGKLGVNWMRVPPGHAAVPFHHHLREDEVVWPHVSSTRVGVGLV